jgi:hypothetical protein
MNEPGTLDRYSHLPRTRTFGIAPIRTYWSDDKRQRFEQMWRDDVDVAEMADFFEISESNVYSKACQWKLGRRRRRGINLVGRKRRKPKRRVLRADPTGQRRKTRLGASEGPKIVLAPHDPRFRAGTTVFPTTVIPASRMKRLLKSGHNSYKTGKQFDRGHWKGMPISTLTLQERDTCPRTCLEWASCYGNNMPFAERIFDDGTLTKRLWGELATLNAESPDGFVVRLHVLGDFYSVEYVEFWRQALADFPALRIFGFTARRPGDPIGAALIFLVRDEPLRFRMRFSGAGYETDSAAVVDKAEDAIGALCPAERDPNKSCATCGFCPSSNKTINFIRH